MRGGGGGGMGLASMSMITAIGEAASITGYSMMLTAKDIIS